MENLQLFPDEALIVRFQKGQNAAFDILINRYKKFLYSYILHLIPHKENAEDLLQETFIKVISLLQKGQYREDGKFPNFLSRVAYNCVIDYYRAEKSDQLILWEGYQNNPLNNKRYSEDTWEDKMIRRQIRKNVIKMIRRLPEEQQEIILMRYYKGLTFREIGVIKGISLNTALGRMHYAVLNMRKMIRKHAFLVTF